MYTTVNGDEFLIGDRVKLRNGEIVSIIEVDKEPSLFPVKGWHPIVSEPLYWTKRGYYTFGAIHNLDIIGIVAPTDKIELVTICHRLDDSPPIMINGEPYVPSYQESMDAKNPVFEDILKTIDRVHNHEEREADMLKSRTHTPSEVNPEHYKIGGIETWDYLKAKLSPTQLAGFAIGNVIKYCSRSDHKGKLVDLEKAAWYLNNLIIELKK